MIPKPQSSVLTPYPQARYPSGHCGREDRRRRDNPIFPFLPAVSAFTAQSKNTNPISFPLFSSPCPPLHSSSDQLVCITGTECKSRSRQSCRRLRASCALARPAGEEAIHSRNCPPFPVRRQTLSPSDIPPLRLALAPTDAAYIVAYIVLTALSFRDREKEREGESGAATRFCKEI